MMLYWPTDTSAAGVTILTHGWNPSLSGTPVWLESMREAISTEQLGGEQHYGTITVTKSETGLAAEVGPWNFDLSTSGSGEVLIVLDWSAVADHLSGGPPAQDVAATVVDSIISAQNGQAPLAELPLHLVGHSRGGGLVCELARLLGEKGIVVDHLTPLDPHPLSSEDLQPLLGTPVIDTPPAIYENVIFADVYLQEQEYPTGMSLSGAYNRVWTAMPGGYYDEQASFANHRNIYLMYQGTIELGKTVHNGEAGMDETERKAWFTAEESGGNGTGYAFSRIRHNVPRKPQGLHHLLSGTGVRENLAWSDPQWPNVVDVHITHQGTVLGVGSHSIPVGAPLELHHTVLDYQGGSMLTLSLDSDRNPYNANDLAVITDTPLEQNATSSVFAEASTLWDTSSLSPGTTGQVYAKISRLEQDRYLYAPGSITFGSAANATFTQDVQADWSLLSFPVDPTTGTVADIFADSWETLISIWAWDGKTWMVSLPGMTSEDEAEYIQSKGFTALTTLSSRQGFWVNAKEGFQLTVQGTYPEGAFPELTLDWNLIGSGSGQSLPIEQAVQTMQTGILSLWKWEDGWSIYLPEEDDFGESYALSKGFGLLQEITPGEGFWVNCQ
ncbi:MAG: hypothetical protein K9J81_09415 [Desulfohalobiaceae bacterium]|nr:hypothetical protein [Desulfohalobiaceae bacterium]